MRCETSTFEKRCQATQDSIYFRMWEVELRLTLSHFLVGKVGLKAGCQFLFPIKSVGKRKGT